MRCQALEDLITWEYQTRELGRAKRIGLKTWRPFERRGSLISWMVAGEAEKRTPDQSSTIQLTYLIPPTWTFRHRSSY